MTAIRHNQAISAALTLATTPSLVSVMRRHPVPNDIIELLHIFSGDELALHRALSWCGTHRLQLMASIENYVLQIMAFDGANAMRVLGVASARDRDRARVHFKLLMRGLHPDQSGDPWREVFAARVITAWQDLSGDETVQNATRGIRIRQASGPRFLTAHHHAPKSGFLRRLSGKLGLLMRLKKQRRPV